MRTFVINGRRYTAKAFDFNLMCDLQDLGLDIGDFRKRASSAVRAYFALCANMDKEEAGNEIQNHIIGGGNFEEINNAMLGEMNDSDFFRSLSNSKRTEEMDTEDQEAVTTKTTKRK